MATKTFERNLTGKSTYKCEVCGKNTRETGHGESGLGLCAFDFELAGMENELSDGHITQDEFETKSAALRKEYKRGEFAPKSKKTAEPVVKTPVVEAPKAKRTKKAAKVEETAGDVTTEKDGARTCRVRLFGKTLTIRFSADSDEVLSNKSYSELRDAARQYIFDCVTSISDAEQNAQVRVVNVEVK